ncbi:hypothetical protein [Propioniciclava flava]|uniref:Uncharacterized protein n=1 Tax=Propioniciclava flava TaxID=2072026 RepID=A0A4Q2EJU1_9ACTN|nr:hypothetical protein [Propioniciclava flava]RXW32744.1 hypothetical protein C1706_06275 [Propioniciclava flava]
MTTTPDADAGLVRAFPTPGPLLGTACRDLYLAAEGSDNQKATIGDPNLLPKPWDPPTCRNPQLRAELWTWLDAVVIWVNHEYVWDPDGTIPPCWPLHPHIVHELAVMADQRRRAGVALDSNALEEWHRYTLPGFLERLRSRLKVHCDQDHQPWPARSRHVRHTGDGHAKRRREAFDGDVQHLSPSEQITPTRPRLRLLNPDTGELLDCHD